MLAPPSSQQHSSDSCEMDHDILPEYKQSENSAFFTEAYYESNRFAVRKCSNCLIMFGSANYPVNLTNKVSSHCVQRETVHTTRMTMIITVQQRLLTILFTLWMICFEIIVLHKKGVYVCKCGQSRAQLLPCSVRKMLHITAGWQWTWKEETAEKRIQVIGVVLSKPFAFY